MIDRRRPYTFSQVLVDLGVLGDRYATFFTKVEVTFGEPQSAPSIHVWIDRMQIYCPDKECFIDVTAFLDTPKLRQRLETDLEEIYGDELEKRGA